MDVSEHNTKLIGVDLGGTKVAAGRIKGESIEKTAYRLINQEAKQAEEIIDQIIDVVENVNEPGVSGIGIGVPSLVNRKDGIVYRVQNIPSWKEVHLKTVLEDHFKIPVFIDNDANCFALGERNFGTGIHDLNFVGITIGTGVGSGIITDGHLFNDANCGSGEFGSIPYKDGIYEDYCSGQFFLRFYKKTGEEIYRLARQKNEAALKALSEFGAHLGNFIKTILFAVDPEKIIIGGSIVRSKHFFEKDMINSIADFPYPESIKKLEIKFTKTENIAILGAASLFYNQKTAKLSRL